MFPSYSASETWKHLPSCDSLNMLPEAGHLVRPAGDLQRVSKTKADDKLCFDDLTLILSFITFDQI